MRIRSLRLRGELRKAEGQLSSAWRVQVALSALRAAPAARSSGRLRRSLRHPACAVGTLYESHPGAAACGQIRCKYQQSADVSPLRRERTDRSFEKGGEKNQTERVCVVLHDPRESRKTPRQGRSAGLRITRECNHLRVDPRAAGVKVCRLRAIGARIAWNFLEATARA